MGDPMDNETEKAQPRPLTLRQKAIIRGYFNTCGRTQQAARACGCSRQYVYQCRTSPAGREYLAQLEAAAIDAMVQAKAAMILAPLLIR